VGKYAMHVVDINDPTQSLVLIKSTRLTTTVNTGEFISGIRHTVEKAPVPRSAWSTARVAAKQAGLP